MGVADASASGDRVATLVALRDLLGARIEQASERDLPALVRQLRDVMDELDTRSTVKDDPIDDLAKRRVARRASAGEAGS